MSNPDLEDALKSGLGTLSKSGLGISPPRDLPKSGLRTNIFAKSGLGTRKTEGEVRVRHLYRSPG